MTVATFALAACGCDRPGVHGAGAAACACSARSQRCVCHVTRRFF